MKWNQRAFANRAIPILASILGACRDELHEIGSEPHLTLPTRAHMLQPMDASQSKLKSFLPTTVQSTWSDSSADLFKDARAIRPGDILTVKISINDKASFDSTANRSRAASLDLQSKLAFDLNAFGVSKSGSGSVAPNATSSTKTDSHGAVARAETIDLLVAATVTEILGNGNLLIRGSQEIRVNHEVRVLSIDGIVRSRDISTDNSISYEKIAEARVSYGGRGRSTEIMQPAIGQQVLDVIAPF